MISVMNGLHVMGDLASHRKNQLNKFDYRTLNSVIISTCPNMTTTLSIYRAIGMHQHTWSISW